MTTQVGDDGKVTPAALNFASKRCTGLVLTECQDSRVWELTFLAGVAVHVGLQRAGSGEALVAHLALVLLLGARRDLGAELAHHRLGSRGHLSSHQSCGARQCPRVDRLNIRASRRVVADGVAVVGAEVAA